MALTCKREVLKDIVEQETRSTNNKIKKERYLWGNKTGKSLARLLKKKTATAVSFLRAFIELFIEHFIEQNSIS